MHEIYAVTGHRPFRLGGYGAPVYNRLTDLARNVFAELEVKEIVSGMALGWDQACVDAAIDLGIRFTAAIPFEGQELTWPLASMLKYRKMLVRANSVEIVSKGRYSADKMFKRNRWMVDDCDKLIALWDGGARSGTADTVRYAEQQGKPVINVWDRWLAMAA